jgi:RNA polymerase sigma factor for flagellar operon FliA
MLAEAPGPPAGGSASGGEQALRGRVCEAYASDARRQMEEKWILDHLPLVRHVVQKISGHLSPRVDVEDLVSAGTLGLVKAARAFDPARDAEFKTYAYIRIKGSVIDELRGQSFVPATVHHEIRRVQEAYRSHVSAHGAPPSDEQLAAGLGISAEQLYRTLMEARRQHFLSIHGIGDDHPAFGSLVPRDRRPSPDEQAERSETVERLAAAIREMPERDRVILLLYYEQDLTMKETAAVLGITESRVSQLHASALFKLAMRLGAES